MGRDDRRCTRHPDRAARAACTECGALSCPECLLVAGDGLRCVSCAEGPAETGEAPADRLEVDPTADEEGVAREGHCPVRRACRSTLALGATLVLVLATILGASLCSFSPCRSARPAPTRAGVIQNLRTVASSVDAWTRTRSLEELVPDEVESPTAVRRLVEADYLENLPDIPGYAFHVARTDDGFRVVARPASGGPGYSFAVDQDGHVHARKVTTCPPTPDCPPAACGVSGE